MQETHRSASYVVSRAFRCDIAELVNESSTKKHAEMEEVRQERIKLQSHLDQLTMQRKKHDKQVKEFLKEKVNLERMLNDVKGELMRKVKQFEEVVNERDILGTKNR